MGVCTIAYARMLIKMFFAVSAGMLGGSRFFINSSLALAGSRRGEFRRYRSVLFCYAAEKYQRERTQGRANLRIRPPWGSPHSRGDVSWVRTHPCRSQHPAERRLSGSSLRPRSYSPVCTLELFSGQANHWTPRPGGLKCVPVGASAVQMAVGIKSLESASPLE